MSVLEQQRSGLTGLRADLILCDFVYAVELPDGEESEIRYRLVRAFPELQWEYGEGKFGRISLRARSREDAPMIGVYLLGKRDAGPCRLSISLRTAEVAKADALRRALLTRLIAALREN